MVTVNKEQFIADVMLRAGKSIEEVKSILIKHNNQIKVGDKVFKVYGKRVLALMHKALDTNSKVGITWAKGAGNTDECHINGTTIRFLKTKAKVFKDGKLVDTINYTQKSRENAIAIIKTVVNSLNN